MLSFRAETILVSYSFAFFTRSVSFFENSSSIMEAEKQSILTVKVAFETGGYVVSHHQPNRALPSRNLKALLVPPKEETSKHTLHSGKNTNKKGAPFINDQERSSTVGKKKSGTFLTLKKLPIQNSNRLTIASTKKQICPLFRWPNR